jgi:ribose transport system substrate-binding protein
MRTRMKASALLVAAGLALGVAACGGGDGAAGAASATQTQSSGAPAVDKELAQLYKGTMGQPPATGPKAAKGKKVLIVSCGQQTLSCVSGAKGAMDAAKAIGWDAQLFDGKFNPALYGTGVQQGISQKVDGIVLDAIDCATARPQLEKARKAGIKIVSFAAYDCDDPSIGGAPLFDGQVQFRGDPDVRASAFTHAGMQARFAAAKQNGKAKVILFKLDALLATKYMREGLERGFARCSGCKVVAEVPLAPTDIGPALQQKVQSVLLKHPEANTVMSGFDVLLLAGVEAGVRASGLGSKIKLFGAEGYAPTADLVRGGSVAGGVAVDGDWQGWAGIDELNRIFNGEKAVDEGLGFQAWDKDHNLDASGPWRSKVDYKSAYEKVWGVG